MSTPDTDPTDVPMDTPDEKIMHKLAQLRADSSRLDDLARDTDVPCELAAQLAFMASEINTLTIDVADYIYGGDELPDACPVCDGPVTNPDRDLEPGESYTADRLCVLEESSLSVRQSIIHYEESESE